MLTELDLHFLYKATLHYYGKEGQQSIDPVVFFKILLVGYLNNISSDRHLIAYCSDSLSIRLYLGYDVHEQLPWYSTISRTRQLYGEEVFLSLFKEVLKMCVNKGMVRGKRQAVDSIHKEHYDRMHQKLTENAKYAKKMSRVRSKTVEPVIGTLVNFTNMKRVNTRGIKNANKHVLMASLTYNLKKYLRFIVKKTSVLAQVIKQTQEKYFIFLKTTLFGLKKLDFKPIKF